MIRDKRMLRNISNTLRQVLTLPEYILKVASIPAGVIAAGSGGSALTKAIQGGTKVWTTPIDAVKNVKKLVEISDDYTVLTAKEFTTKYGTEIGTYLAKHLHGIIEWGTQFSHNINSEPIETIIAIIIVTGLLYTGGRALKFIRQKGQGSYITKMERKLGYKYWPETRYEDEGPTTNRDSFA
jgi:hypothetical protein